MSITDETKIEEGMRETIIDVTRATGLPPPPPQITREEMLKYAGKDRSDIAEQTAQAITRSAEQMIAAKFQAVEAAEKMAQVMRADAEHFAGKLRDYTNGFSGRLADFMLFCHKAMGDAEEHAQRFEQQIVARLGHGSEEHSS